MNSFNFDGDKDSLTFIFLRVFKCGWKTILISCLVGASIAFALLKFIPVIYETKARLKTAQISVDDGRSWADFQSAEELVNSIDRLGDNDLIDVCARSNDNGDKNYLIDPEFVLTVPKNIGGVIDISVYQDKPQIAEKCVLEIFKKIATTQDNWIIKSSQEKFEVIKDELDLVNKRLQQDKDIFIKLNQQGNFLAPAYFPLLMDMRSLEDRLLNLSIQKTKSIKIKNATIIDSPRLLDKGLVRSIRFFGFGVFGGMFFGIFFILFKSILANSRRID